MPALIISVDSDLLIPPSQQIVLSEHIPNATFKLINSDYGHDGFLIETKAITEILKHFYQKHEVKI